MVHVYAWSGKTVYVGAVRTLLSLCNRPYPEPSSDSLATRPSRPQGQDHSLCRARFHPLRQRDPLTVAIHGPFPIHRQFLLCKLRKPAKTSTFIQATTTHTLSQTSVRSSDKGMCLCYMSPLCCCCCSCPSSGHRRHHRRRHALQVAGLHVVLRTPPAG